MERLLFAVEGMGALNLVDREDMYLHVGNNNHTSKQRIHNKMIRVTQSYTESEDVAC